MIAEVNSFGRKVIMHPIDRINLPYLKTEFRGFRRTADFRAREAQSPFCRLAHNILVSFLQRPRITNDDLTALIQIFKWRCREKTFRKYIEWLKFPSEKAKRFKATFHNTMLDGGGAGYTGAPKSIVRGLTSAELDSVNHLLRAVYQAKKLSEVRDACDSFEDQDVPEVGGGIYSPWLHYLRPHWCPITAGSGGKFLSSLGWSGRYSEAIDIFSFMADALGVPHLGLLDAFLWHKGRRKNLVLRDSEIKSPGTRGGRYQPDAKLRRETELHSMGIAKRYYKGHGFAVQDVSKTRPFDLLCRRGGCMVHVEVKGSIGTPGTIELTVGEIKNAQGKGWRTDLFVVNDIEVVKQAPPILKGGKYKVMPDWKPSPSSLIPIRFRYSLDD